MFKTIQECRLDLVAHSVPTTYKQYFYGCLDEHTKAIGGSASDISMDFMPCSAARVSFGNEDKTGQNMEADKKLMKYLADHKHMTPFEYQHATFLIECPLFIRSQIHRHRTFSFNEISRRYTDENLEFWKPDMARQQADKNKQASKDVPVKNHASVLTEFEDVVTCALESYKYMLQEGVCREQARAVLPQSLLTKFYMGGNLRNWKHFIELRRDEHAQHEVQVIASRIAEALRKLWPESCAALSI